VIRRTIITSKILAVAVVSAVGCNRPAGAPAVMQANVPASAPASPGTGGTGPSVASAVSMQASPIAPNTGGRARAAEDPALAALRDELLPKSRDEAFASLAHYRPLCDREGFPLVGNVVRKTPSNYKPSEFCSDLRKRGAL